MSAQAPSHASRVVAPVVGASDVRALCRNREPLLWLTAIVAVGLALRLTWVWYLDTLPLGGDPSWYFSVARNLAEGHGYVADHEIYGDHPILRQPTAFWPPAYPLLLAGIWKAFGVSVASAKSMNAVLGALTIPFVWALGRRIFDNRAGWAAASIYALLPNSIAWLPLLFPEALFTLVFVAALWVLVERRFADRRFAWTAAAFGALAGVAALTRGQGLVLLPVGVVFWLRAYSWRSTSKGAAAMLLAFTLTIVPWTIRNWIALGTPVLISSNAGVTLRIGHAPDATGTTRWPSDAVDGVEAWQSPYYPEWEVRSYRVYARRAVGYALTHPRREADLARLKVYHLYRSDSGVIPWLTMLGVTPITPDPLEGGLRWLFDVSYYALCFAAVASAPFWLRRDAARQLLVIVVVAWTLFHVAFQGEPRYHLPLLPVFAVGAGGGIVAVIDAVRDVSRRVPH